MKSFLEGGKFDKFLVLKNEDIREYVSNSGIEKLETICNIIADMRKSEGKNPSNTYLVINTDEPYAPEIVEILKKNGHWG